MLSRRCRRCRHRIPVPDGCERVFDRSTKPSTTQKAPHCHKQTGDHSQVGDPQRDIAGGEHAAIDSPSIHVFTVALVLQRAGAWWARLLNLVISRRFDFEGVSFEVEKEGVGEATISTSRGGGALPTSWVRTSSTALISRCCSSSLGLRLGGADFIARRRIWSFRGCVTALPSWVSRRSSCIRTPTAKPSNR